MLWINCALDDIVEKIIENLKIVVILKIIKLYTYVITFEAFDILVWNFTSY